MNFDDSRLEDALSRCKPSFDALALSEQGRLWLVTGPDVMDPRTGRLTPAIEDVLVRADDEAEALTLGRRYHGSQWDLTAERVMPAVAAPPKRTRKRVAT